MIVMGPDHNPAGASCVIDRRDHPDDIVTHPIRNGLPIAAKRGKWLQSDETKLFFDILGSLAVAWCSRLATS